ncbi:hypothetical protein NE865_01364 [Phthorimaea operculella]|nr:hypothetical protein NE865_01364 [Phthorimaea operculella]
MAFPPEIKTHAQRVCNLYKQAMRTLEAYYVARNVVRYHQVLLRARFDENSCITDPKEQRRLLWLGQDELFKKKHSIPCMKFPTSLGYAQGVAHGRVVTPPDWVLDYWHPLEKAQYPCYFSTREKRKCEYIKLWYENKLR